jgi:hypothetical protein
LGKFSLFSFEKLFGHAVRAILCTQAQLPKRFTERRRILVEEASEGDLQLLDIRL